MPELTRPDGARIHFEVSGDEGPVVALASYWAWIPGVYSELLADLAAAAMRRITASLPQAEADGQA